MVCIGQGTSTEGDRKQLFPEKKRDHLGSKVWEQTNEERACELVPELRNNEDLIAI